MSCLLSLVACLPAARAAVNVSVGQEFLYSGTVEMKQASTGAPDLTVTGPVRFSALVTEVDAARGYVVILMRGFRPEQKAGQPGFPGDASVTTLRYGADLALKGAPVGSSSPMGAVLQLLSVPLAPRAELKPGQTWRQSGPLPFISERAMEMVATVAGDAKLGDRTCLKIERKLVQALPFRQELPGGTLVLTEYRQTHCIDPATGQVVSGQIIERANFSGGSRRATLDLNVGVTLQETRQLSPDAVASRLKQVAALEHIRNRVFALDPGTNRKASLDAATKEAAAFRKQYPDSPYAPALSQLDQTLSEMREQAEHEAHLESLKGAPAPAFSLKSLEGTKQTLDAYRGKILLLSFFASWCGPCNAEAPHLEKTFWQKYRGRGVVVLGVNTAEQGDPAPKARQFRDQHKLTYPVLVDAGNRVARKYGVTAFPTNVVIDRKGIVRAVETGFDPGSLERMLTSLLKQKG